MDFELHNQTTNNKNIETEKNKTSIPSQGSGMVAADPTAGGQKRKIIFRQQS